MSTDTAQRPSRADQVRTERRKKPGSTSISGLKLHIDKDKLDPAYEYRWVNDTPGRVNELYGRDWDKVEDASIGSSAGTIPTMHVGSEGGTPINAILMRKRKEFYEADQKERQAPLDAMDAAIRGGTIHEQTSPELAGAAYTPGGSNTLDRR